MNLDELRQRLCISVPEGAPLFGVDERTLRRAIADGQVPGIKVGNKTLIPVPKLLTLLGADQVANEDLAESEPLRLVSGGDGAS